MNISNFTKTKVVMFCGIFAVFFVEISLTLRAYCDVVFPGGTFNYCVVLVNPQNVHSHETKVLVRKYFSEKTFLRMLLY